MTFLTLPELVLRAYEHLRHQPVRALELAELRARFRLAPTPSRLSDHQVERAQRLSALREVMIDALGCVDSCGQCARARPLPHGRWNGGFCCGGRTEEIFDDAEIAALKAAGVRARALVAPRSDHSGCTFRGPTGCSLAVTQRPSRCLQYLCSDLRRELGQSGRLARVEAVAETLSATQAAFAKDLEEQRASDEWDDVRTRIARDLRSAEWEDGDDIVRGSG